MLHALLQFVEPGPVGQGLLGKLTDFGVQGLWVVLGEVLGVTGAWWLLSRRFHRLTCRYDAITVPDSFEARFRQGTEGGLQYSSTS